MSVDTDFPLLRFARALVIAHHIPGRVRLKLDGPISGDLKNLAEDAKRFSAALAATAGIRTIALNPLAKSCTIEYDPAIIPSAAWAGFLSGTSVPGTEILLQTLVSAAKA
ncbi:cation transporter [Magnetospirillum sulfuroxidans]|uniref:Cation transporter n=1 Tax=Magnetospirillum sulfuroxidans TaxID=611300 RepID=A0ABS5IGD2_9PROT|nr:cation transporter [Magnetospirillum sulfuroxidans]MBR9973321.1 cation transporter [Magnetospirillum sulfuroxidans]